MKNNFFGEETYSLKAMFGIMPEVATHIINIRGS